jgi:hypothetical protein
MEKIKKIIHPKTMISHHPKNNKSSKNNIEFVLLIHFDMEIILNDSNRSYLVLN